jgi:N-acetylmuramoyl-L-alanine amidase
LFQLSLVVIVFFLMLAHATAVSATSKAWSSPDGYLPLTTLIDDMGVEVRWHPVIGRLDLIRAGGRLTLSTGTSLVTSASGRVDRLSSPVLHRLGALFLPLDAMRHLYRELSLPGEIWSFAGESSARTVPRLTNTAAKPDPAYDKPIKKSHGIDLVVLDAGHGGRDPGAVGYRGAFESVLVLDVTRRVEKRLRAAGVSVALTRTGNQTVSLEKRADIANGLVSKGRKGIFVSIHANASLSSSRQGFETYFLSPIASSAEARSTAAIENGALAADLPQEGKGAMEKIFSNLLVEEYRRESVELAEDVQKGLKNIIGRWSPDRGVRKANFYVMRCIYMPAILVEAGFITNPAEAKLLATAEYRDRIADGIANGILEFIRKSEGLK